MILEQQVVLNEVASLSFRSVADRDYIAARMAHRAELNEPFLWNAQQAIEKYLKAILLYNGRRARGLRHDLRRALDAVVAIDDIPFDFDERVRDYIGYLCDYGPNRYHEYPTHVRMSALWELDRTVWRVRRYCFYLRGEATFRDGERVSLLRTNLGRIHDPRTKEAPHKYRVPGGYLERQLEKKTTAARYLTWQNFYFGRRLKRRIHKPHDYSHGANPFHALYPQYFPLIEQYVDFSKPVARYYSEKSRN